MRKILLPAMAAALALSGCAIREARIAMPSEVAASTDRLVLRGLGGGTRGTFRLGEAQGEFARSAERLGLADPLVVRRTGGGRFTLAASPLGPELAGQCRYGETEANAGPLSVTPDRLAYRCAFRREGRPIAADLMLEDPQSAFGTLHGRSERIGMLSLDGLDVAIRSLHRDAGGGLPTPTPLGYAFDVDGRQVGAVDLNGTEKTLWVPRDPALREAVLLAGLALSVFWDPAVVSPD